MLSNSSIQNKFHESCLSNSFDRSPDLTDNRSPVRVDVRIDLGGGNQALVTSSPGREM